MEKKRRKFTQCPNCGYTFEEVNNYCPNCGQENHDLNVPVKHLVEEFLEGTMHYDAKFWVTLKYLLFKPGLLTEKFNIGQRASYVPPFRLYVFISLVFFFMLAISPNTMNVGLNRTDALENMDPEEKAAVARLDSVRAQVGNEVGVEQEGILAMLEKADKAKTNPKLLRDKLIKNTSFLMFLLMPLFGYLLYLFYRKLRRNYVEHLMFSIHMHSFFFILFTVYLALKFFLPEGVDIFWVVVLITAVYTYLAMQRVYKQTYLQTLLKFIPVSFIYIICLGVALFGNVVVSILLS
ncbi:DUF3667 domain-containing protein [Pontibacter anaerobius]|uniref:DUF3667 domain-containing protein n=1 Tax=Pontibacter anaerobius TaxID=2993940 RepID=A0ABT3RFY9_9BACT|nr:DUF3667 domain-containing protein [Pontibacter anaerobius]MCX2740675.1 DUF3667 domain-containing protein [Pontibacter anaerobius]